MNEQPEEQVQVAENRGGDAVAIRFRPLQLEASRDKKSGRGVFPRVSEQSPVASRYEPLVLSEQGMLYSYTIIHPNPKTGQSPFPLAYVDFPEDVRVFGRLQLVGDERPRIGMKVLVVASEPETDGKNQKQYVFVPAQEKAS